MIALRSLRYSLATTLASLTTLSCTDVTSVEDPDPARNSGRPVFAAASLQGSLPGPGQFAINASVSLPSAPNPMVVYVSVSGDIQVYDNYQNPGNFVGTIPPAGGNQGLQTTNCYGIVQIWYSGTTTYPVGTGCNGTIRTTPIKIQGTGQATRSWGYPGSSPPACGFYPKTPCYYYTGSAQAITLTPIPMNLKLKPSRYVVTSGMSVTFTAFGTPDSVHPYKLPFAVQSWQWVPDSGAASTPCTAGVTMCAKTITSSGTMWVTALLNGEVQTSSVHIRVLCQFSGDSLLDNYPLLDAMRNAWEESSQGAPNERREWVWTVDCDTDGICQAAWWEEPGSSPCRTVFPNLPSTGRNRIAEGHTHPIVPSGYPGVPPDTVPLSCRSPHPIVPGGGIFGARGPSRQFDLRNSSLRPPGWTECIIDLVKVYCWPSGMEPSAAKQQMREESRVQNGCTLALMRPIPVGSSSPFDRGKEESA